MSSHGCGDRPPIPSLNTAVAHPARVYDYWLKGKDNFAADRRVGDAILAKVPETQQSCLDNRGFLTRAVRDLTRDHGIRQFIDVGSGLPTSPNVHEVAQAIAPQCRVLYLDNDPIVQVHGRALLTSSPEGSADYAQADARHPEEILDAASHALDLSQPVAVLLAAILHFVPQDDDPAGIVTRLMDPLPAGSALVLSHMTADGADPGYAAYVTGTWAEGGVAMHLRGREQVAACFHGLDLLEPGIVPVHQWRNEQPLDRPRWWLWSGAALKPAR